MVGGFFVVSYLGGTASRRPSAEASIEENWNRTIKGLGVSPIFPPEEDLVVGDVLAVVVADVDIDRLRADRLRTNSFSGAPFQEAAPRQFLNLPLIMNSGRPPGRLQREVEAHGEAE